MLMQNLGVQTKNIMVFSEVAYYSLIAMLYSNISLSNKNLELNKNFTEKRWWLLHEL